MIYKHCIGNGSGRKRSYPDCGYYSSIYLEGLRKLTENFGQDSRSAGRDLSTNLSIKEILEAGRTHILPIISPFFEKLDTDRDGPVRAEPSVSAQSPTMLQKKKDQHRHLFILFFKSFHAFGLYVYFGNRLTHCKSRKYLTV
jgi:hypothetical protein